MRTLKLIDLSTRRDPDGERCAELHRMMAGEWGPSGAVTDAVDLSAGDDEFTADELAAIDAVIEHMSDGSTALELSSAGADHNEWSERHRRTELHKAMDAMWGPSGAIE